MIKSKLLKIKKWIDANEAAERLSLSLEDKVSALDLLELALDKEIILSVKFPRTKHFVIREVKVASMPYVKRLEETFDFYLMGKFKKVTGCPERGSSEYNSLFEAYLVDECLKNNFSLTPSNECGLAGGFPSIYNVEYEYFDYAKDLEYMDDVIFEEFKGTGNMEVHLDRGLSEKRIFPAIDINKSGTRREELLLTQKEEEVVFALRKAMSTRNVAEVTEQLIKEMMATKNNDEFLNRISDYLKI